MRCAVAVLMVAFAGPAQAAELAQVRPESWAQPVNATGVPNLFKVNNSLFRSAQPTAEGFQNLKGLGIVTVVNLRSFHSDRNEIGATDPKRAPVLVHCQHGADRTGTMTAVYRMVAQGWSKEDAVQEMQGGGFGFHRVWTNLPDWIRDLDVESIREEAGIAAIGKQSAEMQQ